MPVKQEGVTKDTKDQWFQVYKDKVSSIKRKLMRLYLKYLNPKLGKAFDEPKQFLKEILPHRAGLWLLIAATVTALLVFFSPDTYWKLQPLIFLLIFFIAPIVTGSLLNLKGDFKNLLVAYPGKHLLHQEFKLENPINKGRGEITLDGEKWNISGDDCPAGDRVRVIAINESALFVTRVS